MFDYNKLKDLIIPADFGTDDYDDEDTPGMEFVFDQLPSFVETAWGCTQFVIIDPDDRNNYVVKIPFSGMYNNDEDGYPTDFHPFTFCKDYATRSYDLYCDAEDAEVDAIFAKLDFFGRTKNDIPLYVQEKVVTFDYDEADHPSSEDSHKKYAEKTSGINVDYYWRTLPMTWLCAAIDYYGEEFLEMFFEFCENHNLHDFHHANIGWRKDGSPCVLDWAGFQD